MDAQLTQFTLAGDIDAAQAQVAAALREEGFGVLTQVDVQHTLRAKLGLAWPGHRILGVCNPHLAHRALQANPAVGLLLPCNITLESTAHGVRVTIADPQALLAVGGLLEDPAIAQVAREARARLLRVAQALAQPQAEEVLA